MPAFTRILGALAGLAGAAGVAALAAATHRFPGQNVDTAGYILVLHAAAAVALIAKPNRVVCLAAAAMVVGAALFSGDVVFRAATGDRLFPMAAPAGGTLLIAAWLVAAVGLALRR